METPFDRLGPGQVGRLAYQVIGKLGPIFNPNGIRYLSPNAPQISDQMLGPSPLSGTPTTIATALSGVNLLVNVGTLALSAATYAECKKILGAVTQISLDIQEMKSVLRDIQERVKRIDSRVAENNLREAMRHAFRESITAESIDLKELHCLVDDFEGFVETLDAPLVFNFSVRLSSDVRKEMSALLTFLANLRATLAHHHNVKQTGDPKTSVRYSQIQDYFDLPLPEIIALAFHFGVTDAKFLGFADELKQRVYSGFFFSSEEEANRFSEEAIASCFRPVWQDRRSNYATAEAEALLDAVAPLEIDFTNTDNRTVLESAAHSWFYNSDASILHRTWQELRALRDGYDEVFYRYLSVTAEQPTEKTFLFSCDLSDENAGVDNTQ